MIALIARVLALRDEGVRDVADILRRLAQPTVTHETVVEDVPRDADTVQLEQAAIAAANELLGLVAPSVSFATLQTLPTLAIMTRVQSALASPEVTDATKAQIRDAVPALLTLYAAVETKGSNWRAPSFGAAFVSIPRLIRTEGPSWLAANLPNEAEPSLHLIRTILEQHP